MVPQLLPSSSELQQDGPAFQLCRWVRPYSEITASQLTLQPTSSWWSLALWAICNARLPHAELETLGALIPSGSPALLRSLSDGQSSTRFAWSRPRSDPLFRRTAARRHKRFHIGPYPTAGGSGIKPARSPDLELNLANSNPVPAKANRERTWLAPRLHFPERNSRDEMIIFRWLIARSGTAILVGWQERHPRF